MPVDWSLDEIIQANRRKARESKMEQKSYIRKIISKPYSAPMRKGNVEGRWEHDLYEDSPDQSRRSYPDYRTRLLYKDIEKSSKPRKRRQVIIVEDRLVDDSDDDQEEVEMNNVDDEPEVYLKRAVSAGRKKAREAKMEQKFSKTKVITRLVREPYNEPKSQKSKAKWERNPPHRGSVQSRLSFPEVRKQATGIRKHKGETINLRNFLDRLADDKDFQKEQKEKRELRDLDNDLDAYMKKSSKSLH